MRHDIGMENEVPRGGRLCRQVNGTRLIVVHTEDGLFACSSVCTHEDASMEDGVVFGDTIECPLHGAVFNLRNGAVEFGPADIALPIYPVSIVNRRLVVDLPEVTV
jgi:nitrite reductase/ring-hydroxylating ferredoxin subunit